MAWFKYVGFFLKKANGENGGVCFVPMVIQLYVGVGWVFWVGASPFSLDKNNSIHATFQISNKNGEQ